MKALDLISSRVNLDWTRRCKDFENQVTRNGEERSPDRVTVEKGGQEQEFEETFAGMNARRCGPGVWGSLGCIPLEATIYQPFAVYSPKDLLSSGQTLAYPIAFDAPQVHLGQEGNTGDANEVE